MNARTARHVASLSVTLSLCLVTVACGPELQGRDAPDTEETPHPATAQGPEDVETRRVWSGEEFSFYDVSSPSPDGRLISEVDWTTGDLAVIDLESGEMRRVTKKNSWEGGSYAEHSVFSPDGDRMAYSWGAFDVEGGESGMYEVRTISTEGEDMRIVLPGNPSIEYPQVRDWSRDGSRLLLTLARTDRTSEVGLLALESGEYVTLETNDWRFPVTAAFSPDGRVVAYDFPADDASRQRDIFVLATDGSRKSALVSGPGDEILLGWLPDGSGILFHRQTESARDIWQLPVRHARPAGDPELVKRDVWRILPFGFSRDAYYYGVAAELPQVHTVAVDPAAGRALGEPDPVTDGSVGGSRYGAWSPDGTRLAYLLGGGGITDELVVAVESLTGETLREIPLSLQRARELRWTERGFFLYGADEEGVEGIFLLDPVTADIEPQLTITPGEGREIHCCDYEVTADGQELYYTHSRDEDRVVIHRNLVTGSRRILVSGILAIGGSEQSVSPDGEWITYYTYDGLNEDGEFYGFQIKIAPTDGSARPRVLHRYEGRTIASSGSGVFTPDGEYLLVFERFEDERGAGIYRIRTDGTGEPEFLVKVDRDARHLEISPDGRWLSYEDGRRKGEIWRLTGLEGLASSDR